MRLTYEDVRAVKSTGLLPVFGYALLVVLLLGLGAGGFVAWKWTAGSQALQENAALRAQAQQWARIADQQRQSTLDQAAAFDAALGRLNAISQDREDDRKAIQQLGEDLRTDLAALAAARPDLRDVDLGNEFLRHWNKANAGPGAAAPTAPPAGEPGAAVPGAATGDQREGTGHRRPARPGSAAVPRLPQRPHAADRSRAGMARDGVALVLRGRSEDRRDAGRLCA